MPKLKAGFFINGLSVTLIYSFDETYRQALRVRSGEIRPGGEVARRLGLDLLE